MKSDLLTSFITVVNRLGRTPRGFQRQSQTQQAIFKAIFKTSKRSILEIWEIYTQRREDLSRKLISSKQSVVSYLFGFHLPNLARATELYDRSNARHGWKNKIKGKKIKVYDIGCGTGAMSLALGLDADYVLIDSSGPLLDTAKMLAEAAGLNAKTSRRNIEELDVKQFTAKDSKNTVHVYLLGYVWNELVKNAPARRKLLSILTHHIKKEDHCLIFLAEPALEFTSRPAMQLRDRLCELGYLALYPCPHSLPCPMLERPKDWCYSEGIWKQTPLAEWIDEQLGVNRSRYASTLFAFASPSLGLNSDGANVIVGRPVRETGLDRYKGFFDYLVCGKDDIQKIKPIKPKQKLLRGQLYSEPK